MELLTDRLQKRILKEVKCVCVSGHIFFIDNEHIDHMHCPFCNDNAHVVELNTNR